MTLYLPKYCLVPLEARLNNKLSEAAKIYLGELNVLSNRYGYWRGSDEELAEMKDVTVRTILRWHAELEKHGFIRRDTWKEHSKVEGQKGIRIETKRKIYIVEEPSKKHIEPTPGDSKNDNGPPLEDSKNVTEVTFLSSEDSKNVTDMTFVSPRSDMTFVSGIKEQPLSEESEKNNKEEEVVAPFFENLEIELPLKRRLTDEYRDRPEELKRACQIAANNKAPDSHAALVQSALKHPEWKPRADPEETVEQNRSWCKENLKDGTKYDVFECDIYPKHVQFTCVCDIRLFEFTNSCLPTLVKKFLDKCEQAVKQRQRPIVGSWRA